MQMYRKMMDQVAENTAAIAKLKKKKSNGKKKPVKK
jgi:hypothetical protein